MSNIILVKTIPRLLFFFKLFYHSFIFVNTIIRSWILNLRQGLKEVWSDLVAEKVLFLAILLGEFSIPFLHGLGLETDKDLELELDDTENSKTQEKCDQYVHPTKT